MSPTIGPRLKPKIEEPLALDFDKLLIQLQGQVHNVIFFNI